MNEITSTEEALEAFDALEAVTCEFMLGRWKGQEISTNHKLDGVLNITGWYGKQFMSPEKVHPLLFYTDNNKGLYSVNPRFIPLKMKFPNAKILGGIMKMARPFLQTRKSSARLRMVEYRNKVTASMCYDEKAIIDHFAKIDRDSVLGIMDWKDSPRPYIFILRRDQDSTLSCHF